MAQETHPNTIINGKTIPEWDIILTLTTQSPPTRREIESHDINRSRLVSAAEIIDGNGNSGGSDSDGNGDDDIAADAFEREGTQAPEEARLVLAFSDPPKHGRSMFLLGSDGETCDIKIGGTDEGISSQHLYFGFDSQRRVIMQDISSNGTGVSYNGQPMKNCRGQPGKPYTLVLPPGYEVLLDIQGYFLAVEVRNHRGETHDKYHNALESFLENKKKAVPAISALRVRSLDATAHHSSHGRERRDMYVMGRVIGKGGFGVVYKVYRVDTWELFAAKLVNEPDDLEKEMKVLRNLSHERIVKYVDWYEMPPRDPLLIMEYCELGSLHREAKRDGLAWLDVISVLEQASSALVYLHENNVTHRDIKPANILVRSRNPLAIALSDFGLAKEDESWMKSRCGTDDYMAPEMFDSKFKYRNAVDVWALGVVALELSFGLPETTDTTSDPLSRRRAIVDHVAERQRLYPRQGLVNLMRDMLRWSWGDRPTAMECLDAARRLAGESDNPDETLTRVRGSGSRDTARPGARNPGSGYETGPSIHSSEILQYLEEQQPREQQFERSLNPSPESRRTGRAASAVTARKRAIESSTSSGATSNATRKLLKRDGDTRAAEDPSPSDLETARVLMEFNQDAA